MDIFVQNYFIYKTKWHKLTAGQPVHAERRQIQCSTSQTDEEGKRSATAPELALRTRQPIISLEVSCSPKHCSYFLPLG